MKQRVPWCLVLLVCLLVVMAGCQRATTLTPESDPLRLYLKFEDDSLRPGEPLIAEVILLNIAKQEIDATVLNAGSVTFYRRNLREDTSTESSPVYSSREDLLTSDMLEGDGMWTRRFVFPDATLTSGTYTLQATYSSNPKGLLKSELFFAASRAQEYSVTGEVAFQRDRDGILLGEDAVRLACEHFGVPGAPAQARLIVNEAGFLEWLVDLGESGGRQRGILVNPYTGTIRKEVDPRDFPVREDQAIPRVYNQTR